MERKFILSCCSTVDLPYAHMAEREIPVQFYTYVVDGETYVDDMGRDSEALPRFYRFLEEGKLPQTSQINVAAYTEFFEGLLQKGNVLHVAFTSGQSGSVNNAFLAAQELSEKYPDRTSAWWTVSAPAAATVCWWIWRRISATAVPRCRRPTTG